MRLSLKCVFRNVNQHRTGTAGRGDVERFMHHLRQVRGVLHQKVMLGRRARDAERVRFLKRIGAHQLARNLAGDRHDRNRIHHRVDQAGDQIGGARAGGRAAYADSSGCARISLRLESGILLMPDQHVANLMIVQGVVERNRDAAGITEDDVNVFADQAIQQESWRRIADLTTWLLEQTPSELLLLQKQKGHLAALSPPGGPSIFS